MNIRLFQFITIIIVNFLLCPSMQASEYDPFGFGQFYESSPGVPCLSDSDDDLPQVPSIKPNVSKDLEELFGKGYNDVYIITKEARKVLEAIKDEKIRKLAIAISTLVFPEEDRKYSRGDALRDLNSKKLITTIPELEKVHSFIDRQKSTFKELAINPRLNRFKDLLDQISELKSGVSRYQPKILLLLDQANHGIVIEADDPVVQSAYEIVQCLEQGLQLRQAEDNPGSFLPYDKAAKPLDLYLKLAQTFSDRPHAISYFDHHHVWGLLARAYLNLALHAFVYGKQFEEAYDYFAKELVARTNEQSTTYEWFTLFADRLSILMTNPEERISVPGFNTRFDAYKNALTYYQYQGQPGWYSHEGYMKACQTVGSRYTRNVLSPMELSRQHFPDIVMMPYPFELSDIDILRTMPSPNGSHLWTTGFALGKAVADGVTMTPSTFYTHDQQHFATMVWYLSSASILWVINDAYCLPTLESAWEYNKQGSQLYYAALKRLQDMTTEICDEDQLRMNTFLGFKIVHEGTGNLWGRLESLITPGVWSTQSDSQFKLYTDPNYYLPLLSASLQAKAGNRADFEKALLVYASQFIKDFAKNEGGRLVESIKGFVRTPIFKIYPENNGKNLHYFGPSIDMVGYDPDSRKPAVESDFVLLTQNNHNKKLHDHWKALPPGSHYERFYFIDSPFYQGIASPPYFTERLSFEKIKA